MQSWMNTWDANWVNTYLLLKNSGDDKILTSRLNDFEKKYLGEQDASYTLYLQPLHAIHLDSGAITHDESNNKKFSRSYVNIFLSIALFVLLIAVLNFINLATARAAQRAREVGVRKTIGAGKWQLIRQFIAESVLVAALAFLISLGIVHFSLPFINSIIDREMSLTSTMTPLIWLGFILSAIVLGIVAEPLPGSRRSGP